VIFAQYTAVMQVYAANCAFIHEYKNISE